MKWWKKLEQEVRGLFSSTPASPLTQPSAQPRENGQRPLRELMRPPEGFSFNIPPAALNAAMHQPPQQPRAAAPVIPRLDQLDFSAGNAQTRQRIEEAQRLEAHLRRPAGAAPAATPPTATSKYMSGGPSTLISPAMPGGDRRKGPEVTEGKQFTNKGTLVMTAFPPPGKKP